jgi:hypothetical protein
MEVETREFALEEITPADAREILSAHPAVTFTEERKGWLFPTYTFHVTGPTAALDLVQAAMDRRATEDWCSRAW